MVGTVKFEARVKELVENLPDLAVLVRRPFAARRSASLAMLAATRRASSRVSKWAAVRHPGSSSQ